MSSKDRHVGQARVQRGSFFGVLGDQYRHPH